MKRLLILIVGSLLSTAVFAQPPIAANDRAARIFEMIDKSGIGAIIDTVTRQVAGNSAQALRNANVTVTPRFAELLQQTVVDVASDNRGDLMRRLVPLYANHFSDAEVRQLTAFYDSPLGRRLVQVQPQLIDEASQTGQAWGASLLPLVYVQLTIKCRFEPAGTCPNLSELMGAIR